MDAAKILEAVNADPIDPGEIILDGHEKEIFFKNAGSLNFYLKKVHSREKGAAGMLALYAFRMGREYERELWKDYVSEKEK